MSNDDQARSGRYVMAETRDRQLSELIGFSRGLIADNELNDFEIESLYKWLIASNAATTNPLAAKIIDRIREAYADGYVDEDERADLVDTLRSFTGDNFEVGEVLKATTLPICNPAPQIDFENHKFCFTGTFVFGSRSACERKIEDLGGMCGPLLKSTNYLVIGEYATDAWKQSSFGRKIEKALDWKAKGAPIAIIAERHWREHF